MIRNIDHANVIHYGTDSLIFKSTAKDYGHITCIKIVNEEFPSPELLAQLDNEFAICSRTTNASIRKALRKEKLEEHSALVLEYVDGKTLSDYLTAEHPDFKKQLNLAVVIANVLYDLQKENIFHGQ